MSLIVNRILLKKITAVASAPVNPLTVKDCLKTPEGRVIRVPNCSKIAEKSGTRI